MAELKTKKNDDSVKQFLDAIEPERKREDSYTILDMMQQAIGEEPRMWGSSIIGFGDQHYKYESGREGDWFIIGFSPRKANIALYNLMPGLKANNNKTALGKYKTGKSCLYINKLEDVDQQVLKDVIQKSVKKKKDLI